MTGFLDKYRIYNKNIMISRRFIGISVIVLAAAALIIYLLAQPQIIHFLEMAVSADGEITSEGVRQVNYLVFLLLALAVILGVMLIKSEDESWGNRIKQVFLDDPFCSANQTWFTPKFVLIVSTLIGLFLIIHIRLYDPASRLFAMLYLEDGLFESLTPILMVVSIIVLALSLPLLWRDSELSKYRVLLSAIFIFLILIFFLNAMEEISWGQRIFGWETPQSFEGNVQDETNLHNFFNEYYLLFYRLLVLFPIVVILSIWLEMSQRFLIFKRTVLPHPSLLGLSLLIALVSFVWFKEQELLEELFAVFFTFYSLRIYTCFRTRGKKSINDGVDLPTD
jgi:hypothetical protein